MAPPRRRPAGWQQGGCTPSGEPKKPGRRKKAEDEITEDDLLALVPGGLATAFVNARMHDKALAVAGLGEPSDWDGEMPELPEDIATEDHDTLSNLMADFASALSTSTWSAAKAYVEHGFYDQVVDYLESVAMLESQQSSEQKRKADAATQRSCRDCQGTGSRRLTRTTCASVSLARR